MRASIKKYLIYIREGNILMNTNIGNEIRGVDYYLEKFDVRSSLDHIKYNPGNIIAVSEKKESCITCKSLICNKKDEALSRNLFHYKNSLDSKGGEALADIVYILDLINNSNPISFNLIRIERVVNLKTHRRMRDNNYLDYCSEEYRIGGYLQFTDGNINAVRIGKNGKENKITSSLGKFLAYRPSDFIRIKSFNLAEILKLNQFTERNGFLEVFGLTNYEDVLEGNQEKLKLDLTVKNFIAFLKLRYIYDFNAIELIAKSKPNIADSLVLDSNNFFRVSTESESRESSILGRRGKKLKDVIKLSKQEIDFINNEIARGEGSRCDKVSDLIITLERYFEEVGERFPINLLKILSEEEHKYRYSYLNSIINSVKIVQRLMTSEDVSLKSKDIYKYIYYTDLNQALPPSEALSLWIDYLNMGVDMGIDIVKYPKSLVREHSVLARSYKYKEDKIVEKNFEKRKDELLKYEYTGEEFSIIAPKSTGELIEEGKALRHCVASYIKLIGRGESQVFFLRENNNLEKPLITVEISDNKIRQVKGYLNKSIKNHKINKFLEEWIDEKDFKIYLTAN